MSEFVKAELWLFLISILTGIATGIIFDFFRAMRKIRTEDSKIVFFEDLLFWICETMLIFSVLYNFNSGQVRFYFFIGLASGAAIYLLTVSFITVFVFEKIGIFIKFIFSSVFKIVRVISGVLVNPLKKIIKIIIANARKTKKRLKMY